MGQYDSEIEEGVGSQTDIDVEEPPLYKVMLLNDDYTTMEFVVDVLVEVFNKTHAEATQIMLHVHMRGRGICGVYTREVAETKVALVGDRARAEGHPLLCTMEPDD